MKLRRRAVLKWTGAVLCSMVLLLSLCSRFWYVRAVMNWRDTEAFLGVESGGLAVQIISCSGRSNPRHWGMKAEVLSAQTDPPESRWRWWFIWEHDVSRITGATISDYFLFVPMWAPGVLLGAATVVIWNRDRRRFAPGRCRRCGYDLAGLPSDGPCPECGKGVPE